MAKIDLKKEMKQLYTAGKEPAIVTVPEMTFIAYDGQGDPNTSKEFQDSMGVIFGLAYTIKFMCKEIDKDFVVMPLEGLWWTDDMSDFSVANKEKWKWTVIIALPNYIDIEIFNEAKKKLFAKKKLSNIGKARLEKYEDGLSAQILHSGPYAEETPTIEKLHSFIKEQGYRMHKKHREIYFNSPQKVAPEKLKTIIRQPITK